MRCPVCGSRGNCVGHGSYRRCVVDFVCGKAVYTSVPVKRVRCVSCGHTHALLPDFMVPYMTYSPLFLLRVMCAYFRGRPVEEICRRFSITPSMLYQWKACFLRHKEIWLGVLKSAEMAPEHFLSWLFHVPCYAGCFAKPFFAATACSFLQKHKDASFSRHAVF